MFDCLTLLGSNNELLTTDKLTDRCDVGESMRDQHPAVFVLHPLEQLEHGVLHVGVQDGPVRRRVALPPANLLEDKFAEDGEGAAVESVGHHPPLVVGQSPPGVLHPELHHVPGQLGAQRRHLQELRVVLEHLSEEGEVLHQGRVAVLVGAGDHDLAVRGQLERQPGHLVAVSGAGQLVHRVKEDQQRLLCRGELQQLLQEGGDGDLCRNGTDIKQSNPPMTRSDKKAEIDKKNKSVITANCLIKFLIIVLF